MVLSNVRNQSATEADGQLEVHYIDVGQGDCIYITCGDDNMLIDCGEASESAIVRSYLNKLEVTSIDYVIGTHPHSDHMGGMAAIVENFDIGEFIIPDLPDDDIPPTRYFEKFLDAAEKKNLNLTAASPGRSEALGEADWKIIAPIGDRYENVNNYSVGIIMHHGGKSFIFTGDSEASVEEEMVYSGRLEDIDVYKAGHHGSDTSGSEMFLSAISPEIAVISCGEGNPYGHPDDSAVERISLYTDEIYRTDLCGTIVITSDGKELEVRTERSGR